MHLGFELKIEQRQTLAMTPELIQAIKILQYNIQELNEYVDEQLLSNPMLEVDQTGKGAGADDGTGGPGGSGDSDGAAGAGGAAGGAKDEAGLNSLEGSGKAGKADEKIDHGEERRREDFDWQEYLQAQEYDDVSYSYGSMRSASSEQGDDIAVYAQNKPLGVTLTDHLMTQLGYSELRGRAHDIGEYIIEAIDDNGYLTQTAEEIAREFHVRADCVDRILGIIKTFDPVGVGAANLSECLLIQLEEQGLADDVTRMVVTNHIQDIAKNRLSVIAAKCGIEKDEVRRIADIIRELEPKPGRSFSNGATPNYIIPDVIVEKSRDGYSVTLRGDETPRLIVSPYYRKILKSEDRHSAAAQFLSQRLSSAMWLIRSIDQRRNTIGKIADAIVKHQVEFLDRGKKYLRPLTLKMIAEDVEMHESTVSRAVSGKYMQTPRGVFEIKYFFSRGTKAGSAEKVASGGIKEYIEDMIGNEDPASPISDQHIADKLRLDGISISRRAIAKYRDELGIPSSSARRRG